MSRGECPTPLDQRAGCPWEHRKSGCFSDLDHIVPQRYRFMGLLVRKYIDTPENKQQICRWEHDEKTDSPAEDPENCIPNENFMLSAVHRAWQAGQIALSQRDYMRLFEDNQLEAGA